MKKIILFFLALLFCLFVANAKDDDIFFRDNINVDITVGSELNIDYGSSAVVSYIEASLSFYPKGTWRQDVISLEVYPIVEPEDNLIEFRWTNPTEEKLIYYVNSEIKTHNEFKKVKTKIRFPIKNLDSEYIKYTEPGELIDINDDIILLASSLAEGEDDLYVAVSNLGVWVNKNIEYSLSSFTKDASRESSWVLENKKGVCDELTNLFISMCRSLGIPARFVSGYAYTNSPLFVEEWGAHGWAEVYFPNYGWVPFDVTYGQMGYLDAGHIKFKDTIDSDKSSVEYKWQGRNFDVDTGSININTKIKSKGSFLNELLEIEAKPYAKEVDFGSYNLIEATLTNNNDYYIVSDVSLFRAEGVEIVGDYKQFVLLKPKESAKVFWIVKIPDDLQKSGIYTFPFVINAIRNQSYEFDFKSSYGKVDYNKEEIEDLLKSKMDEEEKTYSKNLELTCDADDEVPIEKKFDVSCNIKNFGNINLNNIEICMDNDCKVISLTIMQEKEINFEKTFYEEGSKSVIIIAKSDDIAKSSTIKVLVVDTPLIDIDKIEAPETVNYEDDFSVSFIIKQESLATPKDVQINFFLNDMKENWYLEALEGQKGYQITLKGSEMKIDENEVKILVKYYDDANNGYTAEENIIIKLNNPAPLQKVAIFFKQIVYKVYSLFS